MTLTASCQFSGLFCSNLFFRDFKWNIYSLTVTFVYATLQLASDVSKKVEGSEEP